MAVVGAGPFMRPPETASDNVLPISFDLSTFTTGILPPSTPWIGKAMAGQSERGGKLDPWRVERQMLVDHHIKGTAFGILPKVSGFLRPALTKWPNQSGAAWSMGTSAAPKMAAMASCMPRLLLSSP